MPLPLSPFPQGKETLVTKYLTGMENSTSKIFHSTFKRRLLNLSPVKTRSLVNVFCVITCISCGDPQEEASLTPVTAPSQDTVVTLVEPVPAPKPEPVIDYDTTEWLELIHLDPRIQVDLKYATTNNFVEEQLYDCGRCFLRPSVARALIQAHEALQQEGYGLKMFDCYRPRPIQQKLWDKVPNASYVTPPARGSMHNRGLAVDLTLTDSLGVELDMGTPYDFFGKRAHQDYYNLPDSILQRRVLLRRTLREFGFGHIRTEWWHYSHRPSKGALADWVWACKEIE